MDPYTLPDLPYEYSALEPFISTEIMHLHHDKHHAAYVKSANLAVAGLAEARARGEFARIPALERTLAFNVSGHVLHSLFWQNLQPAGGGEPAGALGAALVRDFGAFDAFRQQLVTTAMTIMGSGWAALAWDPLGRRLVTMQIHDHQSEITQAGIPLLVIDAWEHAYYLQYRTEKQKFFEALFELWDWDDVAARLRSVEGVDLLLREPATHA